MFLPAVQLYAGTINNITCHFIDTVEYNKKINKRTHQDNIIAHLIEQLTSLRKLNVSNCSITNQGVDLIKEILTNTPFLQDFQMSCVNIPKTVAIEIICILKFSKSLKIVNVNNNNFDDETADDMAAVISTNYALQKFSIAQNKYSAKVTRIAIALSKVNTIKVFDVSKNQVTSNGIEDTASALAQCYTLEELNISHNLLTFTAIIKIAQAFRRHPNLQKLNLSNNVTLFHSETEFLVDVILSSNLLLVDLNVCGRNIRPRFVPDHLSPPSNNAKDFARFTLHKLYLSQFYPMDSFKFVKDTIFLPNKAIEVKEDCPIIDKTIISYYVDHDGGTFYNQDHDFAIVIPPGAVAQGDCVEIQATASHFGPYYFSDEFHLISSFFWTSANYDFRIPVYLIMSHYAVIKNVEDIDNLCVLQACVRDLAVTNDGKLVMKEITDQAYFDFGMRYCILEATHFCSVCMASKTEHHISDFFVAHCYTYDQDDAHIAEVCFCPFNNDCKEVRSYVHIYSCT